MDLRLERKDNKELVVIRSSSCVIKIRETSSVYQSCRSDTSTSQETCIFHDAEPQRKADKQAITRGWFSEEDAVVERSPVLEELLPGMSWLKEQTRREPRSTTIQPNGSTEGNPRLPKNVLKLIGPSMREVVHAHSSHNINEYGMLEILIQVLNELKADCKSIFSKNNNTRDDNALKLIIKDCFTEIMVRYATEFPSTSRGNSYNRCQKIISRSIKCLTIECVDILERAICKQAKSMRNGQERETNKSLLIKLMQIIQGELNKSKPVLKVVNTELHQPSFQFIFELLKYFIEKCALGFQSVCQKPGRELNRTHCSGEVSDSSCEISISVADQKLEEYASRLDRLLEKVSGDPPRENPLVIDCYHCTTKCKDQDLLLKTVTRFTEEIKQELINHANIVNEITQNGYAGNVNQNSREASPCSQDAPLSQPHTKAFRGNAAGLKSSSVAPICSPKRKVLPQALHPDEKCSKRLRVHQHSACAGRQNPRSCSPTNTHQPGISSRGHKLCPQHAHEQATQKRDMSKCDHRKSISTSPSRLRKQETIPANQVSTVPKRISVARCHKSKTCSSLLNGSGAKEASADKCRYCALDSPNHKPCAFDSLNFMDTCEKVAPRIPEEIFESGASGEKLPKPPTHDRLESIPESTNNTGLARKIVPKEEQGLVMKSKPKTSDQAKDEKLKKGGGDNKGSLKDEGQLEGKTADGTASLKSAQSQKAKSKSPDKGKKDKKASILEQKDEPQTLDSGKSKDPGSENTKQASQGYEQQKKADTTVAEAGKPSGNAETKKEEEPLLGSGNMKGRKDPAHCCRMNCNCRNRRGDEQSRIRRDSMNQTDCEPDSQKTCCNGCNCKGGQNAMAMFMNGCACKSGDKDGETPKGGPIFQFFASPCNCKDAPKQQKEAQTSKPGTPQGRRDSQETATQTSKHQLTKATSDSEPSSSAPSRSAPSSSAPSTYGTSSGPSGYTTTSSSDPTYLKSSTSQPTSSSRTGRSGSAESCTCPEDRSTETSKSTKDACTSDTNCCCPEKLEEVFQEFDDKYSQVVKEIKFLIREGYIPVNDEEMREITVSSSRSSPQGTSVRTATCRCTKDSCKRCRGRPVGAFIKRAQSQPSYPQKQPSNYNEECEEGYGSGKPPTKHIKYDDNCEPEPSYDECEQPLRQPKYASSTSRDTFIYNELQKDIRDLKELVKKTKFGNCPCCKCCKCEPASEGKPCPPCPGDSSSSAPQGGAKSTSSPPVGATGKEPNKQNVPANTIDSKNEPKAGQVRGSSPAKKISASNEREPSLMQRGSSSLTNKPDGQSETPLGAPYFGTAPSRALSRMSSVPRDSEESYDVSPSSQNEPEQSAVPSSATPRVRVSPEVSYREYSSRDVDNADTRGEKRLSDGVKLYASGRGSSQGSANRVQSSKIDDPSSKSPESSKVSSTVLPGPSKSPESSKVSATSVASPSRSLESGKAISAASAVPSKSPESSRVSSTGLSVLSKGPESSKDSSTVLPVPSKKRSSDLPGIKESDGKLETTDEVPPAVLDQEPALFSTSTRDKPVDSTTEPSSQAAAKSSSGPIQPASSSILKESSKDKIETKTTTKKVALVEEPTSEVQAARASSGFPDAGFGGSEPHTSSDQVLKTASNISFGSKKSIKSTTSSKNLLLSPDQMELFKSREKLRDYSSQVFIAPSESRDTTERRHYVEERRMPASPTEDHAETRRQDGHAETRQRRLDGHSEKRQDDHAERKDDRAQRRQDDHAERRKDERAERRQDDRAEAARGGTATGQAKTSAKDTKDSSSSSEDSFVDSSGDSAMDICKTILDDMEMMPCRFWSTENATPCSVDTYVMVVETETSNDQASKEFIASNDTPPRITNKAHSRNVDQANLKKKEVVKTNKGILTHPSSFFATKGTSTIWRGLTSPVSVLKSLCKLPTPPLEQESKSTEISADELERELSRKLVRKPIKKVVSPLNVCNRYSHIKFRMPKSRDRKKRSGGDLRTYSSESFMRDKDEMPRTKDKEVQVTKWNAMTQTAGPRKFNRTDISKEIEDKLAKYLGLERTVEDLSLSLTFSTNSDQTIVKSSKAKNRSSRKQDRSTDKKRTSSNK